MEKKRQTKVNAVVCTIAVLLCATLCSTFLVGGLYARYTTNASNSARVAAFNIEAEGVLFQTIEAKVKPGDTQDATLTINNNSEVAVECSIAINKVTNNLPDMTFALAEPNGDTTATTLAEGGGTGASAFSPFQIPAGGKAEYILKIHWEPDTGTPKNDLARMGMVDHVTISVTTTQID